MIQLRPAHLQDVDLLAGFNLKLIQDETSRNPMSRQGLAKRMQNWLQKETYQVVVLLLKGAPIGYSVFKLNKDEYTAGDRVFIRQYYIDPQYRSQGIGKEAFDLLRSEYFPAGASLWLEALESNPSGQRFWQKLGFKTYSRVMCLD